MGYGSKEKKGICAITVYGCQHNIIDKYDVFVSKVAIDIFNSPRLRFFQNKATLTEEWNSDTYPFFSFFDLRAMIRKFMTDCYILRASCFDIFIS